MRFELEKAIEILSSTPATLRAMLGDLSEDWVGEPLDGDENEARAVWEPYDVIGHLVHGEETDWIPRAEMILAQEPGSTFEPFDRFAQFERSRGKSLADLLDEFETLRIEGIRKLRSWDLNADKLELMGRHPAFGAVTLRQLLATWVVHDLNHIYQIMAVMSLKYSDEVGPWREYLRILD